MLHLSIYGEGALSTTSTRYSGTFPTSGAMAVWLALAQCRKVSVFGFGSCRRRQERSGTGSRFDAVYYDKRSAKEDERLSDAHNFSAEWSWLSRLDQAEVLTREC